MLCAFMIPTVLFFCDLQNIYLNTMSIVSCCPVVLFLALNVMPKPFPPFIVIFLPLRITEEDFAQPF